MTSGSRVAAIVLAVLVSCAGCAVNRMGDSGVTVSGETEHQSEKVDLAQAKGSDRVSVDLDLHAGELSVDSGAKELLEADFTYNVPQWKPEVQLQKSGFRSTLSVKQGGASANLGDSKNRWEIKLNESVPLDFLLKCGAGENKLRLGQFDLRSVEVHLGAGRVEIDLRGRKPTHDYAVSVHGGVGEAIIHLPNDAGIVATASGGIGEIEVRGLEKQGGEWRRAAEGKNQSTVHVDVHGGIGHILLDAR